MDQGSRVWKAVCSVKHNDAAEWTILFKLAYDTPK